MGILRIDEELILTLLLFHSHVDNMKMRLKEDCMKLRQQKKVVVQEMSTLNV